MITKLSILFFGICLGALFSQSPPPAQPPSSKGGARPDRFATALKNVMDAEVENFQTLKGKDGNIPDKTGHFPLSLLCCGQPTYYAKVTLPGFICGLLGEDPKPEDRPSRLHYSCILDGVDGYLTPGLKRAYENLVEKVKLATDLPYVTMDGGFTKTETRPGSGVFEGYRSTVFSKTPGSLSGEPWIDVSLIGHFGVGGGWEVTLKVGTHWPD